MQRRTCLVLVVAKNRYARFLKPINLMISAAFLLLRGDLPSGYGMGGEFRYANELVEFIRAETERLVPHRVAAYPEMHPQSTFTTRRFE